MTTFTVTCDAEKINFTKKSQIFSILSGTEMMTVYVKDLFTEEGHRTKKVQNANIKHGRVPNATSEGKQTKMERCLH